MLANATWALLLIGFAGVFGMLVCHRRRLALIQLSSREATQIEPASIKAETHNRKGMLFIP